MGKILSTLTREVKMFNIEQRAHKVISKEKPVPAPLHETTIREVEQMIRENPSGVTELQKKDANLDLHLKNIYVLSHDPETAVKSSGEKRPLPQIRRQSLQPEYGYVELDEGSVPVGKFTLKQALQFLTDHQSQPDVYTADVIAKQYKIDQKLAENMIRYYSMFGLHIPKVKGQEKIAQKVTESLENMTLVNASELVLKHEEKEKKQIEEMNNKNEKVT